MSDLMLGAIRSCWYSFFLFLFRECMNPFFFLFFLFVIVVQFA